MSYNLVNRLNNLAAQTENIVSDLSQKTKYYIGYC